MLIEFSAIPHAFRVCVTSQGVELLPSNRIVVKALPGTPSNLVTDILQLHQFETVRLVFKDVNYRVCNLPVDQALDPFDLAGELLATGLFSVVEPSCAAQMSTCSTPNDHYFGQQWQLRNVGQTIGRIDADNDADVSWDYWRSDSSVLIAILDEGMFSHPDVPAGRVSGPHYYVSVQPDPT